MSAVDLARLVKPPTYTANAYGDAKSWMADTMHGRFCYGIDFSGMAYSQTPDGEKDHETLELALAYIHSQYAARVIASLDADLLAELVGALMLADNSSRDLGWHRIYDATGPVLAKLVVQP